MCDVDLKLGHDWTPTKQVKFVFKKIKTALFEIFLFSGDDGFFFNNAQVGFFI